MVRDGIGFGIDTETGRPYAVTGGGKATFESVEDAAEFVGLCTLSRLRAYRGVWDSFEPTVAACCGELSDEVPW
jgi:hypothetical protein